MTAEHAAVEVLDAAVKTESPIVLMRKTALAELSAVDAGIAKLRRQYKGKVYAVDTSEGLDAAKKARADIRDRRYKVPHIVKAQKDAIKEITGALDTEAERITEALEAVPVSLELYGESAGRVDSVKSATLERLPGIEWRRQRRYRPPDRQRHCSHHGSLARHQRIGHHEHHRNYL